MGALKGKIDEFCLAGGTALSLFYFQHRISFDLDFFTRRFSQARIEEIIARLKGSLERDIKLIGQSRGKNSVRMMAYNICFSEVDILKVDFVEDFMPIIKDPKTVDGVNILSLNDIYARKISAVTGTVKIIDDTGREDFTGGRADAKDFYDLYFLSHTFMPLSEFADKYCDFMPIEGLVRWFKTYDRMSIMDGLLSLDTDKKIDCKGMEKHFKKEIERLIARKLDNI